MGDDLFSQNESVIDVLFAIGDKIRDGLFSDALKYFDVIIEIDNNYPFLYERLACIKFWINREHTIVSYKNKELELTRLLDGYYKLFLEFSKKYDMPADIDIIVDIKAYVFNTTVNILQKEYQTNGNADVLKQLCYALVEIGDYKKAIKGLEYLRECQCIDGNVLANLALAYSKIADDRMTKFYIREALFYDPLNIDIPLLRDNIYIRDIEKIIKESAIQLASKEQLLLWLGVYGEVYNILNIRHALTQKELLVLRKMISKFEADCKRKNLRENAIPRLLLAYLRLVSNLLINGVKNVNEIEFIIRKMDRLNTNLTKIFVENINI